ncbi:hypothetical protein NKDENANG_00319 [Candidatus Entotheonellaceae bacterium PAL068K]
MALNEPTLVNRLIADEAQTTGGLVRLQFPGRDDTQHLSESVTGAEQMLANLYAAYPALTVALTSMAVMSKGSPAPRCRVCRR